MQELDARHLQRQAELRDAFHRELRPARREAVAEERAEVASLLADASVVVVEGGHVAVLLNRLRLFGVAEALGGRTVVGCAGGAMVLGPRVVLFHDSPPWGPGHAEVGEAGLGLFDDLIPFPDAAERLRLDDAARVARLAGRLRPAGCATLDPGDVLERVDGCWRGAGARRLDPDGSVTPWREAR